MSNFSLRDYLPGRILSYKDFTSHKQMIKAELAKHILDPSAQKKRMTAQMRLHLKRSANK